jgi:hypothetical protein
MISFNFNVRNPWSKRFENLWCRAWNTPFKNKHIELEVTQDCNLISLMFSYTVRQSHAGLGLEAGIFGYCVHFNFYDSRHWDHGRGCYYTYGDEDGQSN